MFTQFKNIDTAFRHIKTFSIILIVANVLVMGFCIYKSYEIVNQAQNRIHILYNGKVLEAIASDRKSKLPVQLRDHIKTFHGYFSASSLMKRRYRRPCQRHCTLPMNPQKNSTTTCGNPATTTT